jgi:membrane fusion protein (multidrug efflux system)
MVEEARPEATGNNNSKRKKLAVVLFLFLVLAGAVTLSLYISYKAAHITTDDAFMDGKIHTIASKVPGTVRSLSVNDNQFVRKGDVLVELDTADYDVKVREASAVVNSEKGKITEIDSRVEASRTQVRELQARADATAANLELQKANLEQADRDAKRAEGLYGKEAISKERYEKTATAHKVALAQVRAAEEELKSAVKAVQTQTAVIRQAESARVTQAAEVKRREAQLNDAELKYGYTRLYAPADGYVTKKSVEIGNQIQAGQPLMAVVPLEDIYITANYKETQLEKVKVGQKVEIRVDTFPGRKFQGTVESIMAGTGSVFSIFPPENATGNFVKVVQRVPVKIVLDKNTDTEHILRVGMSVEPTIVIR